MLMAQYLSNKRHGFINLYFKSFHRKEIKDNMANKRNADKVLERSEHL